jgi:hypothetical protein
MRILFGFCLFFFSMVGQSVGDSQSNTGGNPLSSSTVSKSASMQSELEALSDTAEDIYNLAKVTRWNKIRKKLDKLKQSEKAIKLIKNDENDFYSLQLRTKIENLEQAISAKNRKDTMHFANNITLIEVARIGELKPRVPTNVMLLDYCGRELEISAEEKDIDKLSNLVIRMHLIWQNLIPMLVDKGDSKEIKNFSEIIKRLERAKTPEEYDFLAKQVLDEVDNIEKVFKKKSEIN